VLRGLLFCGICQRQMRRIWNNEQSYYRCSFPTEQARLSAVSPPPSAYLRSATQQAAASEANL
jgi:site-specific DNA recombinase